MLTLNITNRDSSKKFPEPRPIENQTELLRGVFYGPKEKSTAITIFYGEFKKIWKEAGASSIITLKGVGADKEAVVQDIDFDPIADFIRHVDFYVIERGKKMEVEIPLEFIGASAAVKELGGILVKTLRELKIEVLPKDLPKQIKVDISVLKDFDSKILVKDLKLPESARSLDDEEEVVALVTPAVEEAEEEPAETPDIADVEIEKKGKAGTETETETESAEEKKK
ncbi:MAG: 50S ribosomal protein L25 [Candidatus Pacebacteria bacterium]|nr:50S ribosomal protein L25 [Candidatus Paceibacterota bacterium]